MSTTTKIDLKAFVGPLDFKEEPKTLEECLKEAGGFPFVARAVVLTHRAPDDNLDPMPVGFETQFTEMCPVGMTGPDLLRTRTGVTINVPRWVLVGHRT